MLCLEKLYKELTQASSYQEPTQNAHEMGELKSGVLVLARLTFNSHLGEICMFHLERAVPLPASGVCQAARLLPRLSCSLIRELRLIHLVN